MSEWSSWSNEGNYWTADGNLTWWEAEDLLNVRQSREFAEQLQMEAEARLVRMEKHWKFLRYLFEHGAFDDDQFGRGEGKYDEYTKGR